MIEQVINFITAYKEVLSGVITVGVALLVLGRKRAVKLVLEYLNVARNEFLQSVEDHAPSYAKYIYAKLPKSAKAFITVKRIEKVIIKFAGELQDLDKK